jgi:hypothetical protein
MRSSKPTITIPSFVWTKTRVYQRRFKGRRVEVVEDHMDCGDDIVHEMEKFYGRWPFLWAIVTLPVATSRVANNAEVPLRL